MVIKTVWHWHKDINIGQQHRIKNTEINPDSYGQVILTHMLVREFSGEKNSCGMSKKGNK